MNQADYVPGPLANVEYRDSDGRSTLVFTREFKHVPEKLWDVLTDPEQQREWAPFESNRNLASVGLTTLIMIDRDVEMKFDANVTQAQARNLLEYFWGSDLLRWDLQAIANGTRLTLHHTTGSKDWIPKVAAGWHICLDVANYFLDGKPVGRIVGEDAKNHGWTELHDAYAAKLNIEGTGWPDNLGTSR